MHLQDEHSFSAPPPRLCVRNVPGTHLPDEPHFSVFDTRVDTPVDTCNDTPAGILTEKSSCEIDAGD
jgi:hypothetical protein